MIIICHECCFLCLVYFFALFPVAMAFPCAVYGSMALVCANLGMFLFFCVNFRGEIPSKSLLLCLPICSPEACGSACPLHEVRTIWENSWYFIDILACLNEPISGEFISPNAQLLWNDGVFHPPRLNKWNSVCSKNTLHHGMKHRSQPHSASQWGELGAFWKGPLVRVSLYRGGMGVLLYFPICTKNSVSCFTQK